MIGRFACQSYVDFNPGQCMNIDKEILSQKLILRNSFWSVKVPQEIPDEVLIEKNLIYLDLEDINQLFKLFSLKKNKTGMA
jgi:hypothetical protein